MKKNLKEEGKLDKALSALSDLKSELYEEKMKNSMKDREAKIFEIVRLEKHLSKNSCEYCADKLKKLRIELDVSLKGD